MDVKVTREGNKAVMALSGRFDFSSHRDFRSAYEPLLEKGDIRELTLDLGELDYLDSSALGMLLMLREKGSVAKMAIQLANIKGSVKKVIDIANFGKLFSMV